MTNYFNMDLSNLTDIELQTAIGETENNSPEEDLLMNEFYRRHKEKMRKIPYEKRRRRSYERFVLHDEDINWEEMTRKGNSKEEILFPK